MDDRKQQADQLANKLVALCQCLHKQKLNDGSRLWVYNGRDNRTCVELFSVKGHTQSCLGYLGVRVPFKEEPICDGVYNQYDTQYQLTPHKIELTAATAEELFEKISNCLAPIIAV